MNDELLKTMRPDVGMPHVDPVTPEIKARLEICQQRHQKLWMQGETDHRNALNEEALGSAEAAADAQLLTAGEPSLYTPLSAEHQGRRNAIRARLSSLREARKAARLSWVLEHGSEHLRGAVTGGYDCKRLYVTERAALEYPGYVLDYDNVTKYMDVSCPLPEALKEALWVKGSVVFLSNGRREDDWNRSLPEDGQAVVIRGFLGEHTLLRPYEKDAG